ncbi:MAG TPA: PA domain-containing protein [Acidobacteriota bacterium]|nr:PA domain-containing protein [Acidobacteriota bacterium]
MRSLASTTTGLLLAAALIPGLLIQGWAQPEGTIRIDLERLNGAAPGGQVLLYAPNPFDDSAVNHWVPSASPLLLMMPFRPTHYPLSNPLDISPQQMADIGWEMGESQFNILDISEPSTGFEDSTPFPGAPGNAAATLGEARLNAFAAALEIWGETLASPIDVNVEVLWTPFTCGFLGAASPVFFRTGGAGLPFADTWYPSALAESLLETDMEGPAMRLTFPTRVDEGCLGEETAFYYGLDGTEPEGQFNFVFVALHELGHGLGMSTPTFGGFQRQGLPSIFDHFLLDLTAGETWPQLTEGERRVSSLSETKLVWNGAKANAAAAGFLEPGVPFLEVAGLEAPNRFQVGLSPNGPPLEQDGLTGTLACAVDNNAFEPFAFPHFKMAGDACDPLVNPGEVAGKIALVDRGNCTFSQKAFNLQAAGAVGIVIVNYLEDVFPPNAPDLTVPMAMIRRSEGGRLQQAACADGSPAAAFAHWLSGGSDESGSNTRIVLHNPLDQDEFGEVLFRNAAGGPVVVPIDDQLFSTLDFHIPARGTLEIETDGTGPLLSGSLEVRSRLGPASKLEGTAVLNALGNFVSVPQGRLGAEHRLYVSVTAAENTGVAFFNADADNAVLIEVRLFTQFGRLTASRLLELAPLEQFLAFVTEERLFKDFFETGEGEDFQGTLHVSAIPVAAQVSALALLQRNSGALIAVESSDNTVPTRFD